MKIKSIEEVYNGFLKMLKIKVETKSGEIISREVMSRSSKNKTDDSVASLVYDTSKDVYIFTKQFRSGLYNEESQDLIEIVAGTLEEGEDPKECMKREILEEIGYEVDKINKVGEYYVSPGGTSEKIHLYISEVSNKVSSGGGLESENEEIDIVEMSMDEVHEYEFRDMKTHLTKMYLSYQLTPKKEKLYRLMDDLDEIKQIDDLLSNTKDPLMIDQYEARKDQLFERL